MKKDENQTNTKFQLVENSRHNLLSTPVMDVGTGKIVCKRSGIEKNFYRLDFPSWVNIIGVTPGKEIVLIKQYRFGTDREELEIPGGSVEKGEDPLAAGLRELLEETGYEGSEGRIIGKVCPNPALQDNQCYTVLVENVKKVADPDPDEMEDIETLTMPLESVLELASEGTLSHGLVLNALLFYLMTEKQIC